MARQFAPSVAKLYPTSFATMLLPPAVYSEPYYCSSVTWKPPWQWGNGILQQIFHALRNTSLRKLSYEISRVKEELNPDKLSLIRILATSLVLCFEALLTPDSTVWQLHLHACRTMIDSYHINVWAKRNEDPIVKFLIKEVEDLEIYSSLSCFTGHLPPSSAAIGQYWKFTILVSKITAAERQHYNRVCMIDWRPILQTEVGQAYTHLSAGALYMATHDKDFYNAVLRAHYHALLIYIEQAFCPSSQVGSNIQPHLAPLFDEIQIAAKMPLHTFSHDIFFPLFIAGTECYGDSLRQQFIENSFETLLRATGIWCNYTALHFLRVFWASSNIHSGRNWIQHARENASEIGPLIIF